METTAWDPDRGAILRDSSELTAEEDIRLAELYEWFNEHVPVPPFSTSDFPRDAVSWFKDDAGEPVTMMWDVVTLLREHGVEAVSCAPRILAECSTRSGSGARRRVEPALAIDA